MMKLLLFLCFAAVHVLGEGPKNVILNNGDNPDKTLGQNNAEVNSEVKSSSKKIADLKDPVPVISDVNKKETKLEKISSATVPSSTPIALHSEVTLIDSSTDSIVTTEQTSTVAVHPSVQVNASDRATASAVAPGKWIVNGTNKICVVVQMSVEFNISYVNSNHTAFKTFNMPVDNTTKATGSCGNLEQNLTLTWTSKNLTNNGSMTMHFARNESDNYYSLHHLEVILPLTDFLNTSLNTSMILVHNASSFVVGLPNSYRCLKQQILHLKQNNTNETAGYLTISDLQFQAFKSDNSTVFGLAKDCAFDTPDAVPIAVGCALAGLVIIVLIAYLVGRRRSQARGYFSM